MGPRLTPRFGHHHARSSSPRVLSGGRCKIIRNDCHLIEAIFIFSYSLRDLIRAGRFHKMCRAVGPQVWIDQLEKANCWSTLGADRSAQGRGAIYRFCVREDVADANRAQYGRVDRKYPQIIAVQAETCRGEQLGRKRMGLYRSPLAIFFKGWDMEPPEIRIREGLPITIAKISKAVNVPSQVLERCVVRACAELPFLSTQTVEV